MRIIISIAILTIVLTSAAFAQNTSIYTSTKTSACRTISSNADEGGSYEGECAGAGGYKIRLLEGDIRQTINVITPAKKKFELNFWGFYGGFSYVGEKIEWRMKGKVPVAMIVRYNVAGSDDTQKSTSYLMVSKIGAKESCVTDVIMPGTNQNADARTAADAASSKPCKQLD